MGSACSEKKIWGLDMKGLFEMYCHVKNCIYYKMYSSAKKITLKPSANSISNIQVWIFFYKITIKFIFSILQSSYTQVGGNDRNSGQIQLRLVCLFSFLARIKCIFRAALKGSEKFPFCPSPMSDVRPGKNFSWLCLCPTSDLGPIP